MGAPATINVSTVRYGWEEKISFSVDDLINAYQKGKEKGKKNGKKNFFAELKSAFFDNLIKAQLLGHDFFELINRKGYNCQRALLAIDGINNFKILYIVKSDDYLKKEFKEIYSLSYNFRNQHNNNIFDLSISLMPHSPHINEDLLLADGFILEHK